MTQNTTFHSDATDVTSENDLQTTSDGTHLSQPRTPYTFLVLITHGYRHDDL